MKKLNLLFILPLFLLFLAACEKEESGLPRIITEEELLNTDEKQLFICLIDSVYWEETSIASDYSTGAGILNVSSRKGSSNLIGFSALEIFEEDIYVPVLPIRLTYSCTFDIDTSALNELYILKIDRINRKIFGTFEFNLISDSGSCSGETLKVTGGRFKVSF
ncbi:MAG: hypothetical protein MRY78_18805 [Saprospiraceae bacterium]|nr:hypothetical protein [Saprospiraceae bacterium]